ncbi:SH3 domain-containing protein [Nocardioides sp. HDW12B]|uniref:SH3 domain-containing protein n=1 Tax=Nocardioides sp. HDW12B TaxID=2714939 RepID=UPI0014073604|nr:SH3 domain-containing protein [Nocardioides sp. HDW12B]QIK65861.1 SH3 domain-containing protein [Nocardioides sp. HDW12B]
MPEARHRADHRSAARKGPLGALLAPVLVATLFVSGLVAVSAFARAGDDPATTATAAPTTVTSLDVDAMDARRDERLSRSAGRSVQVADRIALQPTAVDHEFATAPLNIWRGPREQGPKIGVLDERTKVAVTGQQVGTWAEILLTNPERGRVARWVNASYLAENKPKPEPKVSSNGSGSSAPVATAGCTNGTSVPSGVSPNVVAVHEAVCANFPEITTYGTFRSDGEHSQGLAIDIMVSGDRGWQVAEFVRSNYSSLGVSYLIYSQQIWSVDRSGEGWRGMEDRGSTTANHYDHVHVTTY